MILVLGTTGLIGSATTRLGFYEQYLRTYLCKLCVPESCPQLTLPDSSAADLGIHRYLRMVVCIEESPSQAIRSNYTTLCQIPSRGET